MLQIRHVPDAVHRRLRARAALAGMTLSDYLKKELEASVERLTPAELRERLSQLGFTVAPEGMHPFGTKNCCVYLADGTFLEPLAVADATKAQIAAMRGNVFVARDAAWRYGRGEEGFSALVFGSSDAAADHEDFRRAGLSAGEPLAFSRPFIDAKGRKDKASFKLAFAADLRSPDVFFFTCERVNQPSVDRAALQEAAKAQGFPELWVPRAILVTQAIPVLGNGKIDYGSTRELAASRRSLL